MKNYSQMLTAAQRKLIANFGTAWILLLASAWPRTSCGQQDGSMFYAVESAQGVTILEGIHPVSTYQRSHKSLNGKWPRANYVHPLYNLDGEVITEDFPADHGHHRGVFWAWHQVLVDGNPMGDSWVCEDFVWDVVNVDAHTSTEKAVIFTTTYWKSPALTKDDGEMIPFVEEQTTITAHARQANVRLIDFRIELLALLDDVKLGGSEDAKGYGGFSPRIKLADGLEFTGTNGKIEPATTSVAAGPWVDVSDSSGGLTMLVHHSNPGFPQPWVLRRARSMQNPAYPGPTAVPLSNTQPLVMAYRLILHRGALSAADIDDYDRQFQIKSRALGIPQCGTALRAVILDTGF